MQITRLIHIHRIRALIVTVHEENCQKTLFFVFPLIFKHIYAFGTQKPTKIDQTHYHVDIEHVALYLPSRSYRENPGQFATKTKSFENLSHLFFVTTFCILYYTFLYTL